jgi:two-component system chemotaxis response regulator CheB
MMESASDRQLVVIGGSWGGLSAAVRVLRAMPVPFPLPVLLVLHRAKTSEAGVLERVVERDSGHWAREIGDKDELAPGAIALAPPDYHVLIEGGSVSLSVEGPVQHSRPSIDLAFETAADEYGPGLTAVLLSGLGRDGVTGLAAVRSAGGRVLVQDPEEAERPEMPDAAVRDGVVDHVLTADAIGAALSLLAGTAR